MLFNAINDSGRSSLTNMIGWLSLCLVAAGWGAEFDTTIRHLWANIGLFGLAAMIALKVAQWSRLKNQQMVTESRVVNDLQRISRGSETMALPEANSDRIVPEEEHLMEMEYAYMEPESITSDAELISILNSWEQAEAVLEPKSS